MEIDRETWRESMVGDDDPLYVLERYSKTMRRFYETVLAMAPPGASGRFAQLLGEIEKIDAQCSDFLYEEAGAKLGYRDAASGLVRFDDWPEDLRLDVCDTGIVVRNLPAWMLGYGATKQYHPVYHDDKRVPYKRQLWREIFSRLKRDYIKSHAVKVDSSQLMEPQQHSSVLFRFRSQRSRDVKDLDHFLPTLSIVLNAMRDTGLILNDRPDQLSYAAEWKADASQAKPVTDIYVRWSPVSMTPWRDELWDNWREETPIEPQAQEETTALGDKSIVIIRPVNVRDHPL